MQEPRLVACDVDGTLLDSQARATARTIAAVAGVVAAGVPFVLVTGRPPRWVSPVVDEMGHAGLAVCANGAVLYDAVEDRVLSAATLDPVRLRDVADALDDALPGCLLAVERTGPTAAPADDEFLTEIDYAHPWPSADTPQVPRAELFGRPAIKLLVRHADLTSEAMAEATTAAIGDSVAVTFSTSDGLIELAAPGVSKGTGLAAFAGRLGVQAEDVIAFGDMPNDLPMLAWAGHAVAVGNAHPSVIEAADEVTEPNTRDGVALVLERWFSPGRADRLPASPPWWRTRDGDPGRAARS
jgi:Cof subfamily protein (haloacid dehalogenase superfamily)